MPYFPILQKPTQNNLITKTSFRQDAPIGAMRKNRRRAVVETSSLGLHSLVAERRHSSVTRYAKRSVACRDSPRHQPLRAGGTPLPRHRRLPPTSSAIHRIAPSAQYTAIGEKTAEERFHTLARGWLAYPVTPTHHPSTAEERLYKRHPSVCTLSSQSDGTLP